MTPRGQGSGRALVKTKLLLTSALDPVTEPLSPTASGTRLGASLLLPGRRGSGLCLGLLTFLLRTLDMAVSLSLLLGCAQWHEGASLLCPQHRCKKKCGLPGTALKDSCMCLLPLSCSLSPKQCDQGGRPKASLSVFYPVGGEQGSSLCPIMTHACVSAHTYKLATGLSPPATNGLLLLKQEEVGNRGSWNNWGAGPGQGIPRSQASRDPAFSPWGPHPFMCRTQLSGAPRLGRSKAFPSPAQAIYLGLLLLKYIIKGRKGWARG